MKILIAPDKFKGALNAQEVAQNIGKGLLDVLPVVLASEQRNIPVVNSLKENRLIGSITRAEVLNLFSEAIASGSTPGARESNEREHAKGNGEQPNH